MFFKKKDEEVVEVEEFKVIKWQSILISVLFVIMGAVLVVNPLRTTNIICITICSAVLLAGIVFVIIYLVSDFKENLKKNKLVIGIVLMIIGIVLFIAYKVIVSVIPTVIGVLIFINGLTKLQTAFNVRRVDKDKSLWMLILAIVITLVGAFIIFNPFKVSALLLRILGSIMIVNGVTDIVSFIILHKKLKDYEDEAKVLEE